jgi:hypothetical protein
MTDLLTALQSAERGSRELDALVEKTLGLAITTDRTGLAMAGDGTRYRVPHYTTSTDAALALVERVCPGWWPAVAQVGPGKWSADIYDPSDTGSQSPAHAPTPPLALVIALVKAKEARDA